MRLSRDFPSTDPLHPEGCRGRGSGKPRRWVFQGFRSSEEDRSPWKGPFDKVHLPIRVPSGEGKRRKADRPQEPVHVDERPGTFDMDGGSQVPSNHPGSSPEGDRPGFLGGALEFGILSGSFPRRDRFHEGSGLRGSGPHDGACLPFCRGIGGTFTPLDPFSGTFSPRPFLRRSRRTVSDQVLGMRAEARLSARRKKM